MPKLIAPLTDLQVKKAKPTDKPYRLADGKGLYLQVMPNGSKYWRMKYRFDGKEKVASFGIYPETTLAEAREACLSTRRELSTGSDPSMQKKEVRRARAIAATSTFESVAREWYENQQVGWTTVYAGKVLKSLEIDVFPRIGERQISSIEAPDMLEIVRTIESRGVRETAIRALQRSRAVFQYGIMTGRCARNPAADIDPETVLKRSPGVKHMARVPASDIPKLLRDIDAYQGDMVTKLALKFMALTFVRTTEMIRAEWSEFTLNGNPEWRIPPERMKMREPHIVPLSEQAVAILDELKVINGHRMHVFHSVQGKGPISNNTMLFALYRMGYKGRMTGHGFRGLAATVLRENGFSRDVVDRQLAHAERNQVTAAYVHAEYLGERREMMRWWANFLHKPPTPA
ncbi:tyrosine-type recombinase/integrase [Pandoraea sputorum]|uniref:tyrosine-type recombinase/integrase n=1 Tax=Pandoraea sputorum TaxID=93222 RepID=UPI0012416CBE|nr:integrase arm-type DNA-binding domain-containing protein [Pandoraea sputorum]VVE77365.1 integrase [Pandoraea sputorum]